MERAGVFNALYTQCIYLYSGLIARSGIFNLIKKCFLDYMCIVVVLLVIIAALLELERQAFRYTCDNSCISVYATKKL
jgi:hypothetical protein